MSSFGRESMSLAQGGSWTTPLVVPAGDFERVEDGKHVKKTNRVTATYIYRDGRWRGLAVHMVRLP
jgi:hypothetical protein